MQTKTALTLIVRDSSHELFTKLMEDSKSKIQPEDISSSDQESATEIEQTDQFIREASDESSSFFTFRSRVTISLPSEMELLRHEKEEDGGGNEEARFYLYQPPSVSEAGNSPSSLGSLESLTANEDSTEGDKKSATARNLSRSVLCPNFAKRSALYRRPKRETRCK